MSIEKNKNSVVRAVIPTELKNEAIEILSELGVTQSDVILDLYKFIVQNRTIPFSKEEIVTLKR